MKSKLLFIIITIFSFQVTTAQNAKDILDKVSKAYNDAGGLILSFTLNIEDTNDKTTYSHDGKAYIRGNKFKIDIPDGITWFDGKTQWVYMTGSDEVNVSNPTGEELVSISPVALLNIYKTGFKLNYKGEKTIKGKNVYIVEMIPEKKNSDVTKFILNIDKTTLLFTQVTLNGKDKVNNHLIINSSQKGISLPDNTFVFNKKEYPDLEINNLR